MGRVTVTPPDWLWCFVVLLDVSTDLTSQVCDGCKDAARQEIPLDLGEPEFDLPKPGRVRRREMQSDVGMLQQEGTDRLSFMGREVVGDHMDFPALRLTRHDVAEKVHKRGTGVQGDRLAEHLARLGIQRREQRERAISVILELVPLRATRRQRQDRVQPVQRLNGRFLITAKTAAWSGGLR